jgi:hypothetical protein
MIGPSNRVPSDATQIETALAYTASWPGHLGGPVHSTYLRRLRSLGHA